MSWGTPNPPPPSIATIPRRSELLTTLLNVRNHTEWKCVIFGYLRITSTNCSIFSTTQD
eukprot:CCRYP_012562-RB/>CCRYP_012562-RB protein AED:0.48 eAED:0.48 QI:0/-1/0/1/-1/0/1/0/58